MKRKLIQALWSLERAGAERMVFDLVRLLKQRYSIEVIAMEDGAMRADFEALGVPVHVLPKETSRIGRLDFAWDVLSGFPKSTLVHTHLGMDLWLGLVARYLGFRWISTCHNDDRDFSLLKEKAHVMAWNQASEVVFVSAAVRDYWRKKGVQSGATRVIPNGIDLDRFSPTTRFVYRDTWQLLTVARLTPQKNHVVVMKALADLKGAWEWHLIGEGSERRSLNTLKTTLGIAPRVIFHGSQADVRPFFAKADMFVFPSAWEGQGIALLEAAASGVPLILSDLPAFREIFDEESALFVKHQTQEAWQEALEYARDHVVDMGRRAHRAAELVHAERSLEQMVERYVDLYEAT